MPNDNLESGSKQAPWGRSLALTAILAACRQKNFGTDQPPVSAKRYDIYVARALPIDSLHLR